MWFLVSRFLQAQGVTLPMALAATAAIAVHIPLTWLLVFHLQLGFIGAPIAISLSFCTNLTLLLLYTAFSGVAEESWDGFTWQAFYGWGEFMTLAIPSTFMLWSVAAAAPGAVAALWIRCSRRICCSPWTCSPLHPPQMVPHWLCCA